jgi:hypothetical protein
MNQYNIGGQYGRSTLATPQAYQPYSPWQGAPFGAVGQIGLSMLAHQLSDGGMPMGFTNQSTLNNNIRQQSFSLSHDRAMIAAAKNDLPLALETVKGAATLYGREWTPESERAATEMYGMLVKGAPMAANPAGLKLLDQLAGGRSATVMTHFAHLSGQGRYDPRTGNFGMSGKSSTEMAAGLSDYFYGDRVDSSGKVTEFGRDAWRRRTSGIGSYEMGEMMQEMAVRGHLPSAVDGLSKLDSPDKRSKLDTTRVARAIESKTKEIAAVQELFGANGNLDAPMAQLYDTLEQLTGGTQQLTGNRSEMVVRNLTNAAGNAKVSMGGMVQMLQAANSQTAALGINKAFAPQMTANSLNFIESYVNSGLGTASSWGKANVNELAALTQQRMGQGIASEEANLMGVASRMSKEFGFSTEDKVTGTSEQAKAQRRIQTMLKNAKAGSATDSWVNLKPHEQQQLIAQATGESIFEIETETRMGTTNEEEVYYENFGRVTLDAQKIEWRDDIMKRYIGMETVKQVTTKIGNGEGAKKLAAGLAKVNTETLSSMDGIVRANPKLRAMEMANADITYLEKEAAGGNVDAQNLLAKLEKEHGGKEGELRRWATRQYGTAEEGARRENLITQNGFLINQYETDDPKIKKLQREARVRTGLMSVMGSNEAGMLEDSPISRFFDSVRAAGGNSEEELQKVLADTLGIKSDSDLAKDLTTRYMSLEKAQQKYKKIEEASMGDNKLTEEELKELKTAQGQIQEEQSKLDAFVRDDPERLKAVNKARKEMGMTTDIDGEDMGTDSEVTFSIDTLTLTGSDISVKDAAGSGKATRRGRSAR